MSAEKNGATKDMLLAHEKRYIISKSPYMSEDQTYRWLAYLKGRKLKVSQKI